MGGRKRIDRHWGEIERPAARAQAGLVLNGVGATSAAVEQHAAFVAVGVSLVGIGTVFHAAFWVSVGRVGA